tara:strand:+ start:18557 stop:19336 length:780 start_codon:yes stop_codon:yes gene_type:complete
MNLDLKNKNAIVCGSTQGIGEASAIELAKLGANITLIARNESKLLNVLNELDKSQGQVHSFLCIDFSDSKKLKEEVNLLEGSYHILVNNTGGPAGGPITEANTDSFENAFRMHLVNNQILVQKVVENMKAEGYGRIVNIISTSVKAPIPGLGVSNTIRAAVANWSKTLSIELGAYGITVNNVLPGFTNTNRLKSLIATKAEVQGKSEEEISNEMKSTVPAARFGTANEVANAVVFLCTPAASYINGINVPVDGGRTKSL